MRSRSGGFISNTSKPNGGYATGVWTLDECSLWTAVSQWPIRFLSAFVSSSLVDVSGKPKVISGSINTNYATSSVHWERRGAGSSVWSVVSGQTAMTITVSSGGFFYRMVVTSGLRAAKSDEVEVAQYQLVDFQWTQQPTANPAMAEGTLFYLQAGARALRASDGTEYSIEEMPVQWETRLNSSQAWSEMPDKTDSVLWIVSGASGSENGRQYRIRVTGPAGVVYYSNISTLAVI